MSHDLTLKFWWAYGPIPQTRMAKGSTTVMEYMDLMGAPNMPNMFYLPKDLTLKFWWASGPGPQSRMAKGTPS